MKRPGDVAVARSVADVHRDNPWAGRCRGCNEPSPCLERRYANAVLVHSGRPPGRPGVVTTLALATAVGFGMLLIAASALGLVW
ncbi:MAG TPA: hypothetical protein VFZ32_03855 [Micromonosporaceae bacterium]